MARRRSSVQTRDAEIDAEVAHIEAIAERIASIRRQDAKTFGHVPPPGPSAEDLRTLARLIDLAADAGRTLTVRLPPTSPETHHGPLRVVGAPATRLLVHPDGTVDVA